MENLAKALIGDKGQVFKAAEDRGAQMRRTADFLAENMEGEDNAITS